MERDKLRLKDILDAIKNIEDFIAGKDYKDLESNMMLKSAIMAQMMILGEAAKNIGDETKERYSDIEWDKASSMRNVLIHEYFGVEWEIVWDTIKKDIPILKERLQKIYNEFSNGKK